MQSYFSAISDCKSGRITYPPPKSNVPILKNLIKMSLELVLHFSQTVSTGSLYRAGSAGHFVIEAFKRASALAFAASARFASASAFASARRSSARAKAFFARLQSISSLHSAISVSISASLFLNCKTHALTVKSFISAILFIILATQISSTFIQGTWFSKIPNSPSVLLAIISSASPSNTIFS